MAVMKYIECLNKLNISFIIKMIVSSANYIFYKENCVVSHN